MERRLIRLENWIKFLQRRIGKKDDFKGTHEALLYALGGNSSTLECNGDKNTKYSSKH